MAHRRFGAFYARSFERRPWLTLAIANGTLGAIADTIAQTLERINRRSSQSTQASTVKESSTHDDDDDDDVQRWNGARTARFFVFGVGMAPLLAEWNHFIEHRFPLRTMSAAAAGGRLAGVAGSTAAKVSLTALGKRVAVDQIAFAPFGLACFVGAMGFMEGRNVEGVQDKFSEMYWPALLANWQVWPLVQTINFRFMPLRYRVPFTGAIGIAWQVFLSILNANRSPSRQPTKEVAAS